MKRWRKFLLIFLIATRSGATSLEAHYLNQLARAHSQAEVLGLHRAYTQLRIARTACRIQLKEQMVPSACYESLHSEAELKLVEPQRARERQNKLDQLCMSAAEKFNFQGDAGPLLSEKCAQSLRAAQEIKAYRDEEGAVDWPEN